MKRFQDPSFEELDVAELAAKAAELKDKGHMFVNLHANHVKDACELVYAFRSEQRGYDGLEGYVVRVAPGVHVPSISKLFAASFVFENEAQDLFGIEFDGISIDYQGSFYTTTVPYPMNPDAAAETEGE